VKYYIAIAISCLIGAIMAQQLIISTLLLWCCLSFSLVTLAYILDIPSIFRKSQDGRIVWWIRWAFIPFLLGVKAYNAWSIKRDRIEPIQKIAPNLYLSRRLFDTDFAYLSEQEISCIVDVTAEYVGVESLSADKKFNYFSLPVLDHKVPKIEALKHALNWIDTQINQSRSVVVHCALGRGRSFFVAAAYLLSKDSALSVADALEQITGVRSVARLNKLQLKTLHRISEEGALKLQSTCYLIANPVAGGKKWQENEQHLIRQLTKKYSLDIHLTTKEISAQSYAQKAKEAGVKNMIVCGGDGTVGEVASVLADSDIKLGIVPFGTANALCHVLYGVSTKFSPVENACEAILSGNTKKIDVAYCNDQIVLLVVGIGFQEKMINSANRKKKNSMGQFAYLNGFFNAVIDGDSQVLQVSVDGQPTQTIDAQSLVVANTSPFSSVLAQGGGMPEPDDGKLHITYLQQADSLGERIIALSDLTLTSLSDQEESNYFDYQSANHVTIESNNTIRYAIDGEPFSANKLDIKINHNALTICIP
jgi:YegS/Rv2252/BmrU family lipid kinase